MQPFYVYFLYLSPSSPICPVNISLLCHYPYGFCRRKHQIIFPETIIITATHNHMVFYRNLHQGTAFNQLFCSFNIRFTWGTFSGRMIMQKYNTSSIGQDSRLKYLTGMDQGNIQCSHAHNIHIDYLSFCLQIQNTKQFPVILL